MVVASLSLFRKPLLPKPGYQWSRCHTQFISQERIAPQTQSFPTYCNPSSCLIQIRRRTHPRCIPNFSPQSILPNRPNPSSPYTDCLSVRRIFPVATNVAFIPPQIRLRLAALSQRHWHSVLLSPLTEAFKGRRGFAPAEAPSAARYVIHIMYPSALTYLDLP